MVHSAGDGDDLLIAEFIDRSRCWREDSASESQRPEVAFAKRVQSSLVGEYDIVLLAALDLVDLVALQRHDNLMDGQNLLALVLQVILLLRVQRSHHVLAFCIRLLLPFYSSKMNSFLLPPEMPMMRLPLDSGISISPPFD